jgi:hypothetical protein
MCLLCFLCLMWLMLEREHQLLLHAIRPWREVTEWHEEVWILATSSQRILNKEQALESHLAADSILESEMTSADVYAGVCSEIVVRHLRDQRVGAFDREDIQKRCVAAFRDPANL